MSRGYVNAELEATIAAAESEPAMPALHPHLATVFREKVERLASALVHENEEQREAARGALRGLCRRLSFHPAMGSWKCEGISGRCWQKPPTAETPRQWRLLLMLVAGARNKLYRQLCWAAA